MNHGWLYLWLVAAAAWAQVPQAPASLTVPSATSKAVRLAWSASADAKTYDVQRKSGGDYASAAIVNTNAATDASIDAYTTYTYRVIAVNDNGRSAASNEVTVGPPPVGFHAAVTGPADDSAMRFAQALRMVLDANGDPALAYIVMDPNGDGNETDNTLYFLRWNRAEYHWNAPVQVATIGLYSASGEGVPISLALDGDKNIWGIAYDTTVSEGVHLVLALSADGGVTWTSQTIGSDAGDILTQPSLALAAAQVHLAYSRHGNGIWYLTGKQTDDASKWQAQQAPLPGGYQSAQEMVSLALDINGEVGLAYPVSADHNTAEAFWRPAGGAAVVIADNNGNMNENQDIQLSFYGTEPRVAFTGLRDNSGDWDHSAWAARASGKGGNWLPAVNIPSDLYTSIEGPVSISSGSKGQAAIATSTNGGVGEGVCGYPKLSRSDDFVSFRTCGPAPVGTPRFGQVQWPTVRFGGNDKLWVAFQNWDTNGEIPTGVIVWREP